MDTPPTTRVHRGPPPSTSAASPDTVSERETFARVTVDELASVAPTLAERFHTLGVATLDLRPRVTLGRDAAISTPVDLPRLPEGVVDLRELIAEGGMGEVLAGRQLRLRREVAVKRAPVGSPESTHAAMLREAWLAGSLEHPNILPIHTLAREGETPLIVMKRVHGRVWTELLAEQRHALGDVRWTEPLGVLIEVCRALHFAHSRGVLHLDVKPDNVMVGEHGEVLLLDWGVAAAFDSARAPEPIAKTSDIAMVVGTLGYLSPEQARASGAELGPATDVYLLGAVLHEIITGHPPHSGDPAPTSLMSLVSSHRADVPSFDARVPDELAAIARRALAREPSERFADVDAFRRAVEAFLEHRPALALAARADAMRTEIHYDRDTLPERGSMQALSEIASAEAKVDACRFAYQQALRLYPECAPAREGLATLCALRFERAEQACDLPAARSALDDHPHPTQELRDRLDALATRARQGEARVEALRALSADEDLLRDRAVRIRLALTGGASWSVWNLASGWLDQTGIVPVSNLLLLTQLGIALSIVLVVLASVGRRALTSTAVNRRALTIVFAAFAETFVVWLGAAHLGIDPHKTAVLGFAGYVLAGLAVATVLDARTWWGVLLMLAPAFAAARDPANVYFYTAALGPIGGAGLAYLWQRPATPGEEPVP